MVCGSNVIWTASACPVVSVHTASYEGFARWPPEYPTSTFSTPRRSWNRGCKHQKHPPAIVALSCVRLRSGIMMVLYLSGFLGDEGLPWSGAARPAAHFTNFAAFVRRIRSTVVALAEGIVSLRFLRGSLGCPAQAS